jgi:hypothetical protein
MRSTGTAALARPMNRVHYVVQEKVHSTVHVVEGGEPMSQRVYATRTPELDAALEAAPDLGIDDKAEGARLLRLALIGFERIRADHERAELERAYEELGADQQRRAEVEAMAKANIDAGFL